jgi:hypothetical protein
VGKLADFVILSDDPTAIDPKRLYQIGVLVTIKDGAVVYEAGSDTRTGALRRSPLMGDPDAAHHFLQAMYHGIGVQRPVVR